MREVDALALAADLIAPALRECTRAGGELGGNGGVLLDPVGESVFAILDDSADYVSLNMLQG